MTLLKIDRKAITDEDAQKLVDDTYQLSNPLSVPTLFIRPENYEEYKGGLRIYLKQALWSSIEPFIINSGYKGDDANYNDEEIDSLTTNISQSLDPAYAKAACLAFNDVCYSRAHHYETFDYEGPTCSIVASPRRSQNIQNLAAEAVNPFQGILASDLPVSDAQLQFYTLWHEIGHGVGADEPQTEFISATMISKAFESTNWLAVLADMRAVRALEKSDDNDQNEKYGWPMVEVLDYARKTSDKLSALNEDDIIALRFLRFEYNKNAVQQATEFISAHSHIIQNADIAEVTKDLLDNAELINILDPEIRAIVLRFSLAVQRLNIGPEAYENGSLEDQIWQDGYYFQTFPKDVPEFLPEPASLSPV